MNMDVPQQEMLAPNFCEWCCAIGTSRCGRCHSVFYCCRDHQVKHWAVHKSECKQYPPGIPQNAQILTSQSSQVFTPQNSQVLTHQNSQILAAQNSQVMASQNSQILASQNSQILASQNSRVLAPQNLQMLAPQNSQVLVPQNSQMLAPQNSQVLRLQNSQVLAPQYSNMAIDNLSEYSDIWNQSPNIPLQNPTISQNTYDPNMYLNKPMDNYSLPSEDEIFSSLSSEFLSSDNNFWEIINACDAQSLLNYGTDLERDEAIAKISANLQEGAPDDPVNQGLLQGQSLHDICANVVHDLNTYGICVLDSFIGTQFGKAILNEVKRLYNTGIFKRGELVNSNPQRTNEEIRNDVTTWVNGTEPDCPHIGYLMRKLDLVVTTCNKLKNNGQLAKYKLHRRTKAMIACYPGDGTYYKKHIDNPHKDGRCITCIYYLNQNWNSKEHGGVLRMFPAAYDTQIANIEPIFDRMIFFWSDKRNPHEVLPAFATRFAITLWYFDADERDQALMMSRNQAQKRPTPR